MKRFGEVQRIRLILGRDNSTFDCYVSFSSSMSAAKAKDDLNGHNVNGCTLQTKLFQIENLRDDPYDFIPPKSNVDKVKRAAPPPVWFVATYKEGAANMFRATKIL